MAERHQAPYAAIFDMDGVLVDSPGLNWQAMNHVLAEHGVQVHDDEIEPYLGRTLKDQVSLFNQNFGLELDPDEFTEATAKIKKELFADLQAKEGVKELLGALRDAEIPRAVATSMPLDLTEQRLRTAGLLDYFDAIVTSDDITHHKPDPEVFEVAAGRLGVQAANCVVFEDAPNGVEGAKGAGMKVVAIETALVKPENLRDADRSVESLSNVSVADLEKMFAKAS